MQIADGLYYLNESSSVELHTRAAEELRRTRFKRFKLIVLRRLSKDLQIKERLLRRPFIQIHYRDQESLTIKKYKYYLPHDDGVHDNSFGGISGFLLEPPIGSQTMRTYSKPNLNGKSFSIRHHIEDLHDFLTTPSNAKVSGIFLKPSSKEVLEKLQDRIEIVGHIDYEKEGYTVYDCANLLKLYLQQMDQPFFVANYYVAYEKISQLEHAYQRYEQLRLKDKSLAAVYGRISKPDSEMKRREKTIVNSIQLIVQLMPAKKREIFGYFISILEAVYANYSFNRMGANSLGYVFAPLFCCPRNLPRHLKIDSVKTMSYMVSRMVKMGKSVLDMPDVFLRDVWKNTRELRYTEEEFRRSMHSFAF